MSDGATSRGGPRVFPVTRWTVVLAASGTPSPESAAALERLCGSYWYPLYTFVRRSGYAPEDAEDLTQEFFARLLEHNWIAHADRHKGRFRSFLLMAMKRFLAKEWHKANAQKRAGSRGALPLLALDTAETRYAGEPADTSSPEQAFEKQWAIALLETVLRQLRADYEQDGKGDIFELLKPCLTGGSEMQPYAELASRLGMSEGAVKVTVHRLRERYRERLRAEIAHTVASPAEVDSEMRHLFRVLTRG